MKSPCFHVLLYCERSLAGTVPLRKKREAQVTIKLLVIKKKNCSYLYTNFVSVSVLEILFPALNAGKVAKFPGLAALPRPHYCIWNKPNLFVNALLCSYFSNMQYFPNHWLMQIFFNFWDWPWYSDQSVWRLHYISYLGSLGFV